MPEWGWLRTFETMTNDPDVGYQIVNSTIVRAHPQAPGSNGVADDPVIGRSSKGLSTKVRMVMRGLGCLARFGLAVGQTGDAPQAEALLGSGSAPRRGVGAPTLGEVRA